MNASQIAQTARAEIEVARLRHAPLAALPLMQPRTQVVSVFPPKRRLQITIDGEPSAQPQSVKIKITHTD